LNKNANGYFPIYEIAAESAVNGRRHIKVILHEIHADETHYQKNGISWNEEYTRANLHTVEGMSIVAEFVDDERTMPYGHGLTSIRDNLPLFEDATVVGHFDKAYIDDVELGGEKKRVLVAEGTLDEMRYPNFVQWIQEQKEKRAVEGSVEIVGKKDHEGVIVYKDGWKETGRVPMLYDYSGYAILNVAPADAAAVVMELNNKHGMPKEEEYMDEKQLEALKEALTQTVTETNSKNAEYETQIAELNAKIEQLQNDVAAKDAEIAELNSAVETAKNESAEKDSKISEVNAELDKVRNEKAISELNAALEGYTDEQKAIAADDIKAFNENPGSVEINSIVGKICTEIVKKAKEAAAGEPTQVDVFGMVEINEEEPKEGEDPVEVF